MNPFNSEHEHVCACVFVSERAKNKCVVFAISTDKVKVTLTITSLFPNAYKLSNTYIYQIISFRLHLTHVTSVFWSGSFFSIHSHFFCFLDSIGWKKFQWNVCVEEWGTRASWNAIKSKSKLNKKATEGMPKLQIKWRIYFITNKIWIECIEVVHFNSIQWKSRTTPPSPLSAATVQQCQPLCTPNCKCTLFDIYLQFVYKLYQLYRVIHRNFIGKSFALSSTTIK